MKRLVILDFDGTLADTRTLIVNTMRQTIEKLGLPERTDDECAAMIGLPLRQTFTELIPMSEETGDRCVETYRSIFFKNNKPGAVPLFDGVKDTLAALHEAGFTLSIASSRLRQTLIMYLEEFGIDKLVSYVVSASDTNHAKPEPDMVLMTLDKLGFKPDEAIVVGDTKFDVLMAHRAGVEAVGVTYGNGSVEEFKENDTEYIIDSFAEIAGILGVKR